MTAGFDDAGEADVTGAVGCLDDPGVVLQHDLVDFRVALAGNQRRLREQEEGAQEEPGLPAELAVAVVVEGEPGAGGGGELVEEPVPGEGGDEGQPHDDAGPGEDADGEAEAEIDVQADEEDGRQEAKALVLKGDQEQEPADALGVEDECAQGGVERGLVAEPEHHGLGHGVEVAGEVHGAA